MINVETKLIEIFCHIDDFNSVFIRELQTHQLGDGSRKRIKPSKLSESEVMTIVIYFHIIRYRDFKHYYLEKTDKVTPFRHFKLTPGSRDSLTPQFLTTIEEELS